MIILFIGVTLFIGAVIGFIVAAMIASGKIEDLERTISYQRGLLNK